MFKNLVKSVLGDPAARAIKGYREIVERINIFEPELKRLSDADLRAKTDTFRERLAAGETLDTLMPEAFAVVREASLRTLSLIHI